tara:strand:- start:119 stop:730 length:612 start_codon:yes stop_codon:yes gene_type:complete
MNYFKIFIFVIFTTLSFNSYAEEFSFGSIGYTKHTAEDIHDSAGSTYLNDPEENGVAFGFGVGEKSNGIGGDFEINYYPETSTTITTGTSVDVSTLTLMSNLYAMPDMGNDLNLMIGGGIGAAYTTVDTSHSSGGVTFNGDDTHFTPAYQFLFGIDFNKLQIVYKHSIFGEVKGGSGTASDGGTYVADEFDSKYDSINLRFKF